MFKHFSRFALAGVLTLGLTLPLASAVRADHDYTDACHQRLQAQKDKIDHDAAKYGEHSAKVDHDVAKLDNERAWCRDHHADWDHSLFDVGIYIRH
jgi:hypothetical protein